MLLVLLSGVLAALVWQLSVPEIFPRPGLPPERSVQLASALLATAAVITLSPVAPLQQALAVVPLTLRRSAWMTVVLAWTAVVTAGSAALIGEGLAAQHVRNVVAYTGVTMLAQTVAPRLALALPWAWLSVSLLAGYQLVPGADPRLRSWAYPLSPAEHAPVLAVVLLVLGVVGYGVRAARS